MTPQADSGFFASFERALQGDELHMVYQPKIRVDTGELTGSRPWSAGTSPASGPWSRRGSCRWQNSMG